MATMEILEGGTKEICQHGNMGNWMKNWPQEAVAMGNGR